MSRPRVAFRDWLIAPAVLVSVLAIGGIGSRAAAVQQYQSVELPAAPLSEEGQLAVMVELNELPAARVYANVLAKRTGGKAVSAADRQSAVQEAAAAGKLQVARVLDEQAAITGRLAAAAPGAVQLYRVQKAFNGIALLVSIDQIESLRALSGVRSVHPIEMDVPTNSTSVPFLGTPKVWDAINSLGLGLNADGSGIRIGIIDTGIDYLHANFGGTGLAADYTTEKSDTANFTTAGTAAGGSFPTAKVVGGTDFVGDAYNGSTVPVPTPDANPMDCFGHGSHVAGTAAGFGVTSAGVAYAGPYTPAAVPTIKTLRIGPGTAPKALLYALRVFGCGGSTAFTTAAIDWAMDPNNDNDLSDHLDVINMSLGSNLGSRTNSTSVASDNAAAAGVIVVASAGNAGDTFFIAGAPGAGTRVISTAASTDSGVSFGAFGTLLVNAPAGIAGSFLTGTATAFADGPPPGGLTANVVIGLDPADGAGPSTTDGCSPLTNAAAVAGNIAIIDRGTCGFAVKAKNAQNAGAVGVIIANSASAFGNMAGFDETVTIPTVIVQQPDGNTLKANVAGLNVTLWSAADVLASFSSRGPRLDPSHVRLKPDIAAPGLFINSSQTGITCTAAAQGCITPAASGFLAGSQILNISGTSMASPHMAGIMALLRQLHPDWTVEELKALAMNYATADVYNDHDGLGPRHNPSRIGAGRVAPAASAAASVIAMDTDVAGGVNVSFDTEVLGASTQVATVRVVNHGTTSQTYDLAFDTVIDSPGVVFSLPDGASVTVPPGDTAELHVQMDANASLMDHTRDPLLPATQLPAGAVGTGTGQVSRAWLTEESAYLTFKQSGNLKLRVPVYMASRPASAMSGPATITAAATSIPLSGTGACTGTLGAGPTCTGSFPTNEVSLVSPFELQVVSPANPLNAPPYADIQYAGVSYNPGSDMLLFGVSTVGDWSSLNQVSFNICIDNNEDGIYDFLIFNTNGGTLGGSTSPQDTFMMGIRNLSTGGTSFTVPPIPPNVQFASALDSAHFLNNVVVLPMARSLLGFVGADKGFRWKIVTCPGGSSCGRSTTGDHCSPAAGTFFDSANGPFFFDGAAPGLNFNGATLLQDLNGASIPVTVNTANMAANGSLGTLLLHHHNTQGTRAEVVLLDTAQRADLAITNSASPANPGLGQNVTYTLTVTNNGPNDATGVQVDDFPPLGTTYVSDDGAGAYSPGLGIWTVGALANGASATLHLTVSVDVSDQVCNLAQITAGTPLDPNPANNQAKSCLQAPRTADLAVTVTRTSAATVNPGGTVTWQVTVTNKGQDPAYALTTNESFSPVGVTAGGATPTAGVFIPGATGNWKVSSLGPGVTQTLQYSITAPNMAGTLTNTVTAASAKALRLPGKAFDPNLPDNTDSDTVTVLSPSVISTVSKTVTGSFVEGGTVIYTVTLSNTGPFDQQDNPGHEFVDVLPPQLTLVSASDGASPGTFSNSGNTVNWDGSIPAGGSVTITITATINAGTALQTVTNQATVNHDNDGNGVNETATLTDDPAVGGASDPTSFKVLSPASVGTHTKTVSGTFSEGGTVTYTVTISNPSANPQLDNPGDEFTDVLPAGLTLVSASASGGTAVADVPNNTVHWNGGIAAGGSVTITITALINNGTAGTTISNQGTIFFDADGNGTNESSILTDDPNVGGVSDPTTFAVASVAQVPTLSSVGLALLALLLVGGALLVLRRRTV